MKKAKLDTTDYCRQNLIAAKAVSLHTLPLDDTRAIASALGCLTALIGLYEELWADAFPHSLRIVEDEE